ncbi:hypothetical protein MUO14_09705 [Halobacillus shinanisalinarum]|uniref:Uncharacterized protein n=1 Tax=Halobacillus shinanisalinarum TaxID=2932258 RepID=A0ABY4H477_9BACI|nr:hypothetical protein [Halobacillus shinanisalinarum]UOQ95169.1 hypothetical protein MUO14_09705 [Halobacillus shinanisalinarum]
MNFFISFLITYLYYLIIIIGASFFKTGEGIWGKVLLNQALYGFFVTLIGCAIADLLIKGKVRPVLPMVGLVGVVYGAGILLLFNIGRVPVLVLLVFAAFTSVGLMLFYSMRTKGKN